jgi:hypothetical protein
MRSRGKFVGFSLCYNSSLISFYNACQSSFRINYWDLFEVIHNYSNQRIIQNLQTLWFVPQKVEDLLVIYLHIAQTQLRVLIACQILTNILYRQLDQPRSLAIVIIFTKHRKWFSCASDAVSQDSGVYSTEEIVNKGANRLFENLLVFTLLPKDRVQLEDCLSVFLIPHCQGLIIENRSSFLPTEKVSLFLTERSHSCVYLEGVHLSVIKYQFLILILSIDRYKR